MASSQVVYGKTPPPPLLGSSAGAQVQFHGGRPPYNQGSVHAPFQPPRVQPFSESLASMSSSRGAGSTSPRLVQQRNAFVQDAGIYRPGSTENARWASPPLRDPSPYRWGPSSDAVVVTTGTKIEEVVEHVPVQWQEVRRQVATPVQQLVHVPRPQVAQQQHQVIPVELHPVVDVPQPHFNRRPSPQRQMQRSAPSPPTPDKEEDEIVFKQEARKTNRAAAAMPEPEPRIEYRDRIVEKVVEVEVEKIVEKIVEVEVEKIVTKEVAVPGFSSLVVRSLLSCISQPLLGRFYD